MRALFNTIIVTWIGMTVLGYGCQKTPTVKKVISIRATSQQVLADGTALDTIYADLPINASVADLGVTFQASSGLFTNGFDTMSVFANRTNVDQGKITAVVTWQASLRTGADTITASTSTNPVYTDNLTLTLTSSAADSILLTPSAYYIADSLGSMVTIKGVLYNSFLGMVSLGTMVRFSDSTEGLSPNVAVGGTFQPVTFITDSNSMISTIYTPPMGDTAVKIKIVGTVVDAMGHIIGPTGTTEISVSP